MRINMSYGSCGFLLSVEVAAAAAVGPSSPVALSATMPAATMQPNEDGVATTLVNNAMPSSPLISVMSNVSASPSAAVSTAPVSPPLAADKLGSAGEAAAAAAAAADPSSQVAQIEAAAAGGAAPAMDALVLPPGSNAVGVKSKKGKSRSPQPTSKPAKK
jgi:hypothetical protein